MADSIEFVSNYSDQSTENGFQYEFNCDRCNSGFRTRFDAYELATASNIAEGIGNVLGGVFGKAARFGDSVKTAGWEKAHDAAFAKAVKEIKPKFIQCPHCSKWVCRDNCYNVKKALCKECAPDLGVEMAKAQSERSVEEIHRHAAMAAEDKKLSAENWRETIRAVCPKCEKTLAQNAKFCAECGYQLKGNVCDKCGASLAVGTKFCPECGDPV